MNTQRISCLFFLAALFSTNLAYAIDGDIRLGRFQKEDIEDGEFRIRARVGHTLEINHEWSTRARIAGRFSDDERNNNHFKFFRNIPDKDGLRRGDATIDELYMQYSKGKNRVRFGRQQTKMELVGVAKKSLDRNNSPNTDIAWTDGVYWTHQHANGWIGHAILQYNYGAGSTEVRRLPLDFNDSGSRVSTMIAIDKTSKTDFWAQRSFDINYLPDALHTKGVNAGTIKDYWGFVGRLATQWSFENKAKFLIAGEFGHALNTPDKSVFNLGSNESTDGNAWQTSFNIIDFAPHHSIGLVLGKVDAGWLLSPDFRSNNTLVEIRYRWNIMKTLKFEARTRRREEIDKPIGQTEKRVDDDSYFRLTWKF